MGRITETWKRNKGSLTYRFVVWVSGMAATVLFLLGILLFFHLQTQMNKEQRLIVQSSLSQMNTIFGQYVDMAENLAVEYFNSSEGKKCRVEETDIFLDNMGLLLDIKGTLASYPYLHSIYILNREDEVALYATNGKHFTEELDEKLVERLHLEGSRNLPFMWCVGNRYEGEADVPLLSVYVRETPSESVFYSGTVVVNIDLRWLTQAMFPKDDYEMTKMYVLDYNGIVVLHSDGEYYGDDFSDRKIIREVLSGNALYVQERGGMEACEIITIEPNASGFRFFAESGYINSAVKFRELLVGIGLGIVLLTVLILGIVYIVGLNLFAPIRNTVEEIQTISSQTPIDVYDGNELEYIRLYHKSMSDYMMNLEEQEQKDRIVKKLLLGGDIQKQLLEDKRIYEGLQYCLIMFHLLEDENEVYSKLKEYSSRNKNLGKMISNRLKGAGVCSWYEVGVRQLLFLVSAVPEQKEENDFIVEVELTLQDIVQSCSENHFVVLMDSGIGGQNGCEGLFRDMNSKMKTRLLLNAEEAIIRNCDEGPLKDYYDKQKNISEKEIIKCLENRNKGAYIKAVNHYLDVMQNVLWEEFLNNCNGLFSTLLDKGVAGGENGLSESYRIQLEIMDTRDSIMNLFVRVFEEVVYGIHEANICTTTTIMERAVDYINNHYDDKDLNVNTLARKMNISVSYFGKLFKDFTDCSMSEYLTKIRMEKARNLLLMEELEVAEIADTVGYGSSTYFTTVFKKYFGVSPSKMRNYRVLNEDGDR